MKKWELILAEIRKAQATSEDVAIAFGSCTRDVNSSIRHLAQHGRIKPWGTTKSPRGAEMIIWEAAQ